MSASPSARTSSGCAASKRVVLDLASEAMTLGTGARGRDAGARAAGLPRDERELAEDARSSPSPSSTATARRSAAAASGTTIRCKLEEFPDHLIKAALATEDRRFFEHWGIDPIGTFRALTVNARGGGVVQGGSSITQQLAKNLFLNNERSLERKIKEAFLAVWLEFHLSKNEILKLYLDRAYMGGGTFGAAAAAEYYFGKSVKDITLAEVGDARRPVQGADQIRPARQPAGGPRPRQRRAQQHGRGGLPDRGPDPDRAAQPGDADRPQARHDAGLLSRLGLRAGPEARRRRQARQRPRARPSRRRSTPASRSKAEQTIENILRQYGNQYDVEQRRHGRDGPGRRGARHASAGATTARASSTGRRTRCASRARRSSPTSMRRRSRPGCTARTRS